MELNEQQVVTEGEAKHVAGPLPGRCGHFVQRKRRYCKMIVSEGKKFCGEHAENGEETNRRRIPCPLDPKQ